MPVSRASSHYLLLLVPIVSSLRRATTTTTSTTTMALRGGKIFTDGIALLLPSSPRRAVEAPMNRFPCPVGGSRAGKHFRPAPRLSVSFDSPIRLSRRHAGFADRSAVGRCPARSTRNDRHGSRDGSQSTRGTRRPPGRRLNRRTKRAPRRSRHRISRISRQSNARTPERPNARDRSTSHTDTRRTTWRLPGRALKTALSLTGATRNRTEMAKFRPGGN